MPFQFGAFYFFFLIVLVVHPVLCWIEMLTVGTLMLFLGFGEKLSAFLHTAKCDASFEFVICGLYSFEIHSSIPKLSCFFHERILNFIKFFFYICWDDHLIYILHSINMIHVYWFAYGNHFCVPGTDSTWSWSRIFLMFCWKYFSSILLGIFAFTFIKDVGL